MVININENNKIIDNIDNTEIKQSNVNGEGLFATKNFIKGETLAILDGQILSWDKNLIDYEWNAIPGGKLLVRPFRTKYSYINHSKDSANLEAIFDKDISKVVLKTLRNIEKGEELLVDYYKEPLNSEYMEIRGKNYL